MMAGLIGDLVLETPAVCGGGDCPEFKLKEPLSSPQTPN